MDLAKSQPLWAASPWVVRDKEWRVSKGPFGLRRAEFGGSPPHPPSSSQSRRQDVLPRSHGRGVWTQRPGVSEMDGKGQGIRQADGQGPIAFLWKGSLASSGDSSGDSVEEGRSRRVEEAEAGKGGPQLQPFSPGPPVQLTELQEAYEEEVCGGSRAQSLCQPWTPPSGLLQAPSPSKPQKRERPNHRQLSPAEEQQRQEDRGRTHTGGHPARSKPSSSLALRCPL